jgi:hypothetical protein
MFKKSMLMYGFFIIVVVFLIYYFPSLKEGLQQSSSCSSRSNCNKCISDGYDNTGSLCYWCKDKGCVNPDNYYNAATCSSSLHSCGLVGSLRKNS